jgi:hypothetical protein
MSINANGSRLETITRELFLQWQTTKDYWKDAKSQEFERQYLEELMTSVGAAVTVIGKVDKLVTKIKSDCE